ncbi:MAG TPA: Na(+)-translocating NADH-quinone reductase subunit A [Candidatus Deferrimicrobium sp.]|nr:Na(+)-translocating NADH-quinone reductase subunit A [Candidatus Deferrimicrobium sp.]
MSLIRTRKGLDVPISGEPTPVIFPGNPPKKVAVTGYDYIGMKPTMAVTEGERVKKGQLLFTDKNTPGVKFTAPGSGLVMAINRGPKRVFESLVIQLDDSEDEIVFNYFKENELAGLAVERVKDLLIESGLWTSLRARPFGKIANPGIIPHSIFITAMDTNPLAPPVEIILAGNETHFQNGLAVISRLTPGKIYLCKAPGTTIPLVDLPRLTVVEFDGPHPAGNAGTHIHFLDPVNREKTVWHIDAHDVAVVGQLFTSGRISTERVISLAGPAVKHPRLIKTRIGAFIEDLVKCGLKDEDIVPRIISGSLLSGRTAAGPVAFLGRYHQQISVVAEGGTRHFLGWLNPGLNFFAMKPVLFSGLRRRKKFAFTTDMHGAKRAVFPSGAYEDVMPMDLEITYLLRALMIKDIGEAENLGCLELCEEDLALCSFVSPSKIEYGPVLRENLTLIEKEG